MHAFRPESALPGFPCPAKDPREITTRILPPFPEPKGASAVPVYPRSLAGARRRTRAPNGLKCGRFSDSSSSPQSSLSAATKGSRDVQGGRQAAEGAEAKRAQRVLRERDQRREARRAYKWRETHQNRSLIFLRVSRRNHFLVAQRTPTETDGEERGQIEALQRLSFHASVFSVLSVVRTRSKISVRIGTADPSRLASLLVVAIRRVFLLLAPRQPGASTAQIRTSIFSRVLSPARVSPERPTHGMPQLTRLSLADCRGEVAA